MELNYHVIFVQRASESTFCVADGVLGRPTKQAQSSLCQFDGLARGFFVDNLQAFSLVLE